MDLMESKWFLEKPDDFEDDYTAITCPVGRRCCVMAVDGETKWFSKKGFKLPGYFLSHLPGGNLSESKEPAVTMLDCIFHEEMFTYFILDGMIWNNEDLKSKTYEDRIEFLKTEMGKRMAYKHINDINHFKFVMLKHYSCTKEGMEEAIKTTTFEMDGLLFYKKGIPYTSGVSEEVLWTKPFMLPDIFEGLALSEVLLNSKPDGYTTFEKFVEDVQAGREPIKAQKKKKKKKGAQEIIQPPKGAWFPQRPLSLPPPPKQPETVQQQAKQQKGRRRVKQWSYYGPGTERPRVYGRGKVTGQNYYGDGKDVYYPPTYPFGYSRGSSGKKFRGQGRGNQKQMPEGDAGAAGGAGFGPVGSGSTGKKVTGGVLQQEVFGMGDMQAALAYLNYDQQQLKRQPLHQKN